MVYISPATLGDLQPLIDLEKAIFTYDKISRRQFRYLLTEANGFMIKIENQEMLLGYMMLLRRKSSRNMRVYSICIRDEARNLGYGRRLLSYAEETAIADNCNSISLEVSVENIAAQRLYESVGFTVYGKKMNYYDDGGAALLLRKELVYEDAAQ
jgi:ribosomal protein S18 acetylase RimI-like enzyme